MTLDAKAMDEGARLIERCRRPLLLTHEKPDGDALGALSAMGAILQARGAEPTCLLFDDVPPRYALFGARGFGILGRTVSADELASCDGVVVLDTCTYNQLRPVADWLRGARKPKLAVDHHVTRDSLAEAYVVDESAAATCLILHEWAGHAGWPIDAATAQALFVGIAMDTGWFHHSNTGVRALAAAAKLSERGATPNALYESLFQRDSPGRVRLLGEALKSLELRAEGRLAVMTLDRSAFAAAGGTPAETEDIINEPLRIASVAVSVLLVDAGERLIRVSLRSRASETGEDIDVSAVAQSLGGGGHRQAAGAKVPGTLQQVRASVLQALEPLLITRCDPA